MAQAGNFEDYMKSSVLDLSSIEWKRPKEKKVESANFNLNPVITFTGSKLWLDLQLDSSYYKLEKGHEACLKFCYDTNFRRHMERIKDDSDRAEGMACQANCLNKVFRASELVNKAVENHPLLVRNASELMNIEQEVSKFNEDLVKGKKDYSF